MRGRVLPGPAVLDRRPLGQGEEYVAYRIVRTDDREDPTFVASFESRGAQGLPPRRGTAEERHPSLSDGISAYRTREAAAGTALSAKARKRSLGEYTAELRLVANNEIEIAEWGAHGHLTIWGEPLILASTATDIRAIP